VYGQNYCCECCNYNCYCLLKTFYYTGYYLGIAFIIAGIFFFALYAKAKQTNRNFIPNEDTSYQYYNQNNHQQPVYGQPQNPIYGQGQPVQQYRPNNYVP
jgi:hypothetical protein